MLRFVQLKIVEGSGGGLEISAPPGPVRDKNFTETASAVVLPASRMRLKLTTSFWAPKRIILLPSQTLLLTFSGFCVALSSLRVTLASPLFTQIAGNADVDVFCAEAKTPISTDQKIALVKRTASLSAIKLSWSKLRRASRQDDECVHDRGEWIPHRRARSRRSSR